MPKSFLPAPSHSRMAVPPQKRPDFFIVGAPKCGTTAMADYLAEHPDLYLGRKEMHFFGSDLEFGPQIYRRDLPAYLEEFKDWQGQLHGGEASVWYLFSERAAAEIKAFNPQARIIIMLREPVEMLYSLYHQFRSDGNEHLPTFQAALEAQKERRASRLITRQTYLRQALNYHEAANYTAQIRRYFQVFGREQVQVILYDDLVAKPDVVFGQVLKFLGVKTAETRASFPVVNGNKSVKSPILRAVMADPLVRGTAIALRSWLPRPAFAALQNLEGRLLKLNLRSEKRPPLDPALRASLQQEFQPEVKCLGELLGRDLSHWSQETVPVRSSSPPAQPVLAMHT